MTNEPSLGLRLVEDIANLTFVIRQTDSGDPVALHALQEGCRLVDRNVGVEGEFRFARIPLEAIGALHDAAVEKHLANKPISDLAEKLWHRANFGSAPAPA